MSRKQQNTAFYLCKNQKTQAKQEGGTDCDYFFANYVPNKANNND